MFTEHNGEPQRKCASLSTKEADALFFPSSGGKVNKARAFCAACPFKRLCLEEAIDLKLEGFWAGTTDKEREGMRRFKAGVVVALVDFLPPEPKKVRRVYRKVSVTPAIHALWMDEVEPTEADLLVAIIG